MATSLSPAALSTFFCVPLPQSSRTDELATRRQGGENLILDNILGVRFLAQQLNDRISKNLEYLIPLDIEPEFSQVARKSLS